ncbi:fructosamine kinase FrlD [Nonomuraea roseoviolacea subsp. roseoviolacea]|uniref:Fructoselysine 6-kinase n=1 Tax=Nonomuraea roseoviolacea subsp. carminata TaxID=160689 RepID=A0ABT1JSI0_9ACTN|nr:PfkB family carbohydrate kinase [Nonomuraea roseoviolacea]MCP2344703.1 fructoselysine 6-kinase [Nonomuraea roseoviolacea subsp. carminata]
MRLAAVGDNITDCYLDAGRMYPGGNCVNVAVHAARAGARASYVGSAGRDERGDRLAAALREEGVDVSRLRRPAGPTGYATVVNVGGERVFGPYDRGVARFRLDEADMEFVAAHDMAHSSYSADLEEQLPALAERVPLSFDFDSHTGDDYAAALIPYVTYAFFSASHLGEAETGDLLRWAVGPPHHRASRTTGARVALATRGAAGAWLFDGRELLAEPAVPVEVVDTLGAGDTFIAHVLTGLAAGLGGRETLRRASAHAARVCTALGAFGHAAPLTPDIPRHPEGFRAAQTPQ